MKIGIITDPASTFRIGKGKKSKVFDYYNVPDNIVDNKMSFLDYFAGNFIEIRTLSTEIQDFGSVETVIYCNNQFIHQNEIMTIFQLFNIKETHFNFVGWFDDCDVLILSIGKSNIHSFVNIVRLPVGKRIIVSSGISDQPLFVNANLFVRRPGVARFGEVNRRKIRQFLKNLK